MGDYKYQHTITVSPGSFSFFWNSVTNLRGQNCFSSLTENFCAGLDVSLWDLIYEPPRNGPTLWEIGVPDRSAAEFYVPDPNPLYINELYDNHPDRFCSFFLRKLRFLHFTRASIRVKSIAHSDSDPFISRPGSGSMDCGRGMPSYIPTEIWCITWE